MQCADHGVLMPRPPPRGRGWYTGADILYASDFEVTAEVSSRGEEALHAMDLILAVSEALTPPTQPRKLPTYFFSFGSPSQHSLRLLQETSFGQTLAAVGSTRAVLLLMQFAKPGAHGLAAENQIRDVGA